MAQPEESLAALLRRLRSNRSLTQKDVGRALRISVPLLSSWESGKATPPRHRLEAFARLIAVEPAVTGHPRLRELDSLTPDERDDYERLLRELLDLRGGAEPDGRAAEHPLRFPAGQPITIVCSELPERLRSAIGYSDVHTPDYIESYQYADLDGLIELLPHIGGLNPASTVTTQVWSKRSEDDLRTHLIALGGVDFNPLMQDALASLRQVPVQHLGRETDEDIGGFNIRDAEGGQVPLRPVVVNDRLRQDVAHFLRAPNPFNPERTITLFGGMYSRGIVGLVRALTHPEYRDRNAEYLTRRFGGQHTYSIVSRVEVVANQVVVPDWTRAENRLHEWPPPA